MITMPPNFTQFIAEEKLTSRPLSPSGSDKPIQGFFAADQLEALSVFSNPWHTLIWPNSVSPIAPSPIISRFRDATILREWAFATMAGLVECRPIQDETLTLTQHFRIPYPHPSLQPSFTYDTYNDRWGYPSLQAFRIPDPYHSQKPFAALKPPRPKLTHTHPHPHTDPHTHPFEEHQKSPAYTHNPFLFRVDFLDPTVSQRLNHASLESPIFPNPPNPLIHTYHKTLPDALHYMTQYLTGSIPRPTTSQSPPPFLFPSPLSPEPAFLLEPRPSQLLTGAPTK